MWPWSTALTNTKPAPIHSDRASNEYSNRLPRTRKRRCLEVAHWPDRLPLLRRITAQRNLPWTPRRTPSRHSVYNQSPNPRCKATTGRGRRLQFLRYVALPACSTALAGRTTSIVLCRWLVGAYRGLANFIHPVHNCAFVLLTLFTSHPYCAHLPLSRRLRCWSWFELLNLEQLQV
jgi:hypothetical protein